MAVRCSKCGEELLGAVNRCWKCGTPFVEPPTSEGAPPVRRSPVPVTSQAGSNLMAAEVLDGSTVASSAPGPQIASAALPPTRRRGSPFADEHTAAIRQALPVTPIQPPRPFRPTTDYARTNAATGGAVVSLLLGIFAIFTAYYIPIGAIVAALLGIGMGLWGLYSQRRGVAIAGLLLCCIALAVGGFFGAVELYTLLNGRAPWEPDPSLQTGPDTSF